MITEQLGKYNFEYRDNTLHWYGVNIKEIAENVGTPVFIFSTEEFVKRIRRLKENTDYDHLLCFSLKSNNNPYFILAIKKEGYGVDVVSGGELYIARKAGVHPKKIVFSGVGKTNEEIQMAQKEGILLLNIESESEYKAVKEISKSQNLNFGISFRVKFEIALDKLHPYLGVGKKESKFGINEDLALELYKNAISNGLPIEGIHFHLGSQIKDLEIFRKASELCENFLGKIESFGCKIKYVDVGGGLGLDYEKLEEPNLKEYIDCFKNIGEKYKVIFELGRYLSAPSGILISKVIRKKEKEGSKVFLVVDSGMTETLRIPLYKVSHKVIPVNLRNSTEKVFDIVGPICENSDYIAQDIVFPNLEEGDLICVLYAGAYTTTMSSNYNGRLFPPEIIISNQKYFVSRKRQDYQELFSRDQFEEQT